MRIFSLVIVYFLLLESVYGQTGFTSIGPSPTPAALAEYAISPVNLATGIPEINVPIATISSHTLSLPISLSYHAQGIKVNEYASWVGMGWSLNAGGVITREVQGFYDDCISVNSWQQPGDDDDLPITVTSDFLFHGGYLYNNFLISEGVESEYLSKGVLAGVLDLQPDNFYYNFMGKSGSFMFNQNEEAVTFPYQELDIEWDYEGTGHIQVKDDAGYIYIFRDIENMLVEASESCGQQTILYPFAYLDFASTWYISEVINPNGQQEFLFEYELNSAESHIQLKSESLSITSGIVESPGVMPPECISTIGEINECLRTIEQRYLHLSRITYLGGRVEFHKQSSERVDLPGDYALEGIEIFNEADELVTKVGFDYSYKGSPVNQSSRLFLNSLNDELTAPAERVCSFDYYKCSDNTYDCIPEYNGFSQDHWGFNNNKILNTTLIPSYSMDGLHFDGGNRNADLGGCRAGTLRSVTDRNGAITEYDYELNTIKIYPTNHETIFQNSIITNKEFVIRNFAPFGIYSDDPDPGINAQEQQTALENFVSNTNYGYWSNDWSNSDSELIDDPDVLNSNNQYHQEFTLDEITCVNLQCIIMAGHNWCNGNVGQETHAWDVGFRIRIYREGEPFSWQAITDINSAGISSTSDSHGLVSEGNYDISLNPGTYHLIFIYYFPIIPDNGILDWSFGFGPQGFYAYPPPDPCLGLNTSDLESIGISPTRAALGGNCAFAKVSFVDHQVVNGNNNFFTGNGGGLRVARISTYPNTTNLNASIPPMVTSYDYLNTGRLLSMPRYSSKSEYHLHRANFDCDSHDMQQHVVTTTLFSQSQTSLERAEGGYVLYDRVKVRTGLENGFTIYSFENNPVVESTGFPYVPNDYEAWKSALLIREEIFNEAGERVKLKYYTYEDDNNHVQYILGYKACHNLTIQNEVYDEPFGDLSNECYMITSSQTHVLPARTYRCTTGRKRLKTKSEYVYPMNSDEDALTTFTDYFYDNPNIAASTRSRLTRINLPLGHKDREQWNYTKYVSDYSLPIDVGSDEMLLALKSMRDRNMMSIPIESLTLKGSDEDHLFLLGGSLNTFTKTLSGLILPNSKHMLRLNSPMPTIGFMDENLLSKVDNNTAGPFFWKLPDYARVTTNDRFDELGRVLETSAENDIAHSVFRDYEKGRVVAEVINATLDQCAYSSFETDNQGGWDIHNCPIEYIGWGSIYNAAEIPTVKTGLRTLRLTAQPNAYTTGRYVSKSIESGSFVLSFWSTHGTEVAIDFDGEIEMITDQVFAPNTWKLNVYKLTNASSIPMTLRLKNAENFQSSISSGLIDELRIYPFDARMKSITYNLDGSVHDICDENNFCQYYGYDSYKRLEWTLDENMNILQHIEYHLKDFTLENDLSFVRIHAALEENLASSYMEEPVYNSQNVLQNISYVDGFGRPIQSIAISQSPRGDDLISFQNYDALGRQPYQYLSYSREYNLGHFVVDPLVELEDFYQTSPQTSQTSFPFAKTRFEHSPLSRVLEQGATGEEWQLSGGHTSKHLELLNAEDEVIYWTYNEGNLICGDASGFHFCEPLTLFKTESEDENGKKAWSFTNYLGQVVLVRTAAVTGLSGETRYTTDNTTNGFDAGTPLPNQATVFLDTYYVYDEFGQKVFELPAAFNEKISTGNIMEVPLQPGNANYELFSRYVFAHKYDSRGRAIMKKEPDVDWSYYIYNNLNQVVMSQDAEQRLNQQWAWVKYDALGRPILTGVTTNSTNRETLQSAQDIQTNNLWENRSYSGVEEFGYSNISFPTNMGTVLTATYYDDFNFNHVGLECTSEELQSTRLLGLVTGTKTLVLDSDPLHYLTSVIYYNQNNQVLQSCEDNLLGGWLRSEFKYDFSGKLMESTSVSIFNPDDVHRITVKNRYEYDLAGRTLRTYQQMGRSNPDEPYPSLDPEVLLSKFHYNEVGQLVKKEIHIPNGCSNGMQTIDYRYNARGWLRKINNAELVDDGDNLEDYDVFGEELFYSGSEIDDDVVNELSDTGLEVQPLYNGQISMSEWKTKEQDTPSNEDGYHAYLYRYDDLYRMTNAIHAKYDPTSFSLSLEQGGWNEKIDYDLAGNIFSLNRSRYNYSTEDATAVIEQMDQLNYSYVGNRLMGVEELGTNEASASYKHFVGANAGNDYAYDIMGRLSSDLNKSQTYEYNLLGKLKSVQLVSNSNDCIFTYDALGNKLKKQVGDNITYYLNGAEYTGDGELIQLPTSEGCVRLNKGGNNNTTSFLYDYYLTDHLGNIRVVLTEENAQDEVEVATLEPYNIEHELEVFEQISGTEHTKPSDWPELAVDQMNAVVSKLSSGGHMVGPSKLLRVNPGDEISVDVESWYRDDPSEPTTGQTLMQMFGSILVNLTLQGLSLPQAEAFSSSPYLSTNSSPAIDIFQFLENQEENLTGRPNGSLVYIYLDKYLHLQPDYSGVCNVGEPGELKILQNITRSIPFPGGYFYVFITNRSAQSVYFNNLHIVRKKGTIRQKQDYYPYGLTWENISEEELRNGAYQGKDFQQSEWESSGLDYYDFGARMYDPVLGRWHAPDPAAQHHSLYLAMGDNPVMMIDPSGLSDGYWTDGEGIFFDANVHNQESMSLYGHHDGLYLGETWAEPMGGSYLKMYPEGGGEPYFNHLLPDMYVRPMQANYELVSMNSSLSYEEESGPSPWSRYQSGEINGSQFISLLDVAASEWAAPKFRTAVELAIPMVSIAYAATGTDIEGHELSGGERFLEAGSVLLKPLKYADEAYDVAKGGLKAGTKSSTSLVQSNRTAGNLFRDELAEAMRAEGRVVNTEVYKWTPFGKRYMDLDVWHNGVNLGGIETKVGGSRYLPLQIIKDAWLGANGYPVQLVRRPPNW